MLGIGTNRGFERLFTPAAPGAPTPTVWLRFGEVSGTTATDTMTVRNGTYVNSPDLGLPDMVTDGGGFGVKDGQYCTIPHLPVGGGASPFAVAGGWSASVVVQTSKLLAADGDRYGVFNKGTGANAFSWEIIRVSGSMFHRTFTTTDGGVANYVVGPNGFGPAITVGTDQRVTVVQRTTGASAYIGATEFGPNATVDGLDLNTHAWGIGGFLHPTQGLLIPLNGCIGEFQFFNFAMTPQQVALLSGVQDTIWIRDAALNIDEGSGSFNLAALCHPETGLTPQVVSDGTITNLTAGSNATFTYTTPDVTVTTADTATVRVTKGALTSRTATLSLSVIADGEVSMQPVTIQGNRFYSGGQPYFPTTHFLWGPDGLFSSHVYFSSEITAAEKAQLYNDIKNAGFNSIYIYLFNQNDYGSQSVSPLVGNSFSSGAAFDDAKLASWKTDLIAMINDGIRPFLWLRADDSPLLTIGNAENEWTVAAFKAYISRMIEEFDDLPIMWVLGLEVGEYWTAAQITDFGTHLSNNATKPVGSHFGQGVLDHFDESWCQFACVQNAGVSTTAAQDYNYMMSAKAFAGTKPVIWGEYFDDPGPQWQGNTTLTRRLCLAGTFTPSAGFGCGGPDGLGEFMESLPDGMTSTLNAGIITLTGGGVTAQADLTNITWGLVNPQRYGFVDFGEDNTATSNRHYTATAAAVLNLTASTGWAWFVFTRFGQNAGTQNQYILSTGLLDANPSLNWFTGEASHSGIPNEFGANVSDATTDNIVGEATGTVSLNQIKLLVLQYNPATGNMELYSCVPGAAAVLLGTATGPDGNVAAPGPWNWGRRSDGETARYFQEEMGGLGKVSRRITPAEIASIGDNSDPVGLFGADLDGWWPCLNGAEATILDESGNGNHLTRQGNWGGGPVGQEIEVPSLAEFLINDRTPTPAGATVVTTAAQLTSALGSAAPGDVIECNPPAAGISHWNLPSGLTFPAASDGNRITVMARQGKGIVVNSGEAYALARTPNSGFWNQDTLTPDDVNKQIWRSRDTFAGGAQQMLGMWIEFNHPHYLCRMTSMAQLRAAYATGPSYGADGNTNGSYFGPAVYQNSDGRVYIRFQRPHPGKYSARGTWVKSLWPNNPEAVNGSGQIVYPMSQNPNNYPIYLTRTNPGSGAGAAFRGGPGFVVGPGINSCTFRETLQPGRDHVTIDRGTHWCYLQLSYGESGNFGNNWFFHRARFSDGSKRHLGRAEFKFSGPLVGIRSCMIRFMPFLKDIYALNCTFADFHEFGVMNGGAHSQNNGQFRFRNCVFFSSVDEGIQGRVGMSRFELGYCYFLNAGFWGQGLNGDEDDEWDPGKWFVHHNVFDCRCQNCYDWNLNPGPQKIAFRHSPGNNQPQKIYNNLIFWGPDQEQEAELGVQHLRTQNVTVTGTARAHEVFNNMFIRHDSQRYLTEYSENGVDAQTDWAVGFFHVSPDASNEFWDYNLIYRDVPGPLINGLFRNVYNTGSSGAGQYANMNAWRNSGQFNTSKGSGSMRGGYSPGFEGNGTDAKPSLPSLDDFNFNSTGSRFNYRPAPTSAVTVAAQPGSPTAAGSLSGANWWSSPGWGTTHFGWSAGGGPLAPNGWKGPLDPNGNTITVGVLDP